ncbi:MAG: undecaprenyl/decaprenyl-phosphate alpha-N-acetylglucosaminyl 1-phosphate transferase, partial [Lentisphaeria bacterium]|nr:undecaprenyl/decaprenyl-phosphate alpha-N-acetylglucosaminyl 1-phosphate transferase [Lentisphaeria bacterium]
MTTALTAFLVACLVGVLVTHAMTWLAPKLGAVDQPDGFRKIHTRPIPYLGGVGVFAGFLAPVVLLLVFFRGLEPVRALWEANSAFAMVLLGSFVALFLGAWDDIHGMRPGLKLLLQALAACIGMAGGHLIIWRLNLPFVGDLVLGAWGIPLTLFWFLGCMNAINLLDGMDGLAGGVTLIACLTLMATGHLLGNAVGMLLMACLGGGILGFLTLNFHPARIFLGDSGSNVIGYLVAALALMTSQKSSTAVALLVPVLALGLPIMDTSLAMLRRWSHWLPISAPDRRHVHHILLSWGLSQRRAVLILYAASLVLCVGAFASISQEREPQLMVFGGLGILLFVCMRVLGAVRLTDVGRRFSRDWKCRNIAAQARIELEKLASRLPHIDDLDATWNACGAAFPLLGVDDARLILHRNGSAARQSPREWTWATAGSSSSPLEGEAVSTRGCVRTPLAQGPEPSRRAP